METQTYGPACEVVDVPRIMRQMDAIRDYMLKVDTGWKTLAEISEKTGYPEASVSAQLRHLRKPEFGSYRVDKRRVTQGTWEYKVYPKETLF